VKNVLTVVVQEKTEADHLTVAESVNHMVAVHAKAENVNLMAAVPVKVESVNLMVEENANHMVEEKAVLMPVVAKDVLLLVETVKVENANHLTVKVDQQAETVKVQSAENALLNNSF
jgi:hypothetical protein